MSSTRSIIAPPPFAENALTVIPPTPVAGVSYRDPVAGPASSADGWPYAERVNSAEWNQIMYQISSLVSIVDAKGVLGWSSAKDYVEASVVFGSDGILYKWLIPSGPNNGGAQDPTAAPTYWQTLSAALSTAALPLGYLSGFNISNNAGAPNTTADVGAGSARNSTNTVDINLSSTFSGILQTSGAWAAGTGQNKLDAGAKANNSTYFIFAIRKTSDGTGDILFSLSPTAPTMPSGYSGFVRLKGRLVTGVAGNIGSFKNRGNGRFDWTTPVVEVRAGPVAIGTTLITLAGLGVLPAIAEVQLMMRADGGAGRLLPTDVTDSATGVFETDWTGGVIANAGGGSADESSAGAFRVTTNTSGQITLHTNAGANIRYAILTTGWQEI